MKFGEYLRSQVYAKWEAQYLDYDRLKSLIKALEARHLLDNAGPTTMGKGTSLSVPPMTNAAGMPVRVDSAEVSQEMFFSILDQEMKKIESFTKVQVTEIRSCLHEIEGKVLTLNSSSFVSGSPNSKQKAEQLRSELYAQVEDVGEKFLQLEKFVNLNFTGFHKILKKHDRRLPNPCKSFYLARLHDQSWVRGDYSDVIVKMSQVYSTLRGDEEVKEQEAERQDFVRSTRKYWVHTENISRVKYIILQHLPVFLQKGTMQGETDSQLVNSVYVDNDRMELYHGRLDKSPGAIALRFRWYGTGTPELVFVERKTHRESWAGEVSVKERFTVKEPQVLNLLTSKFDIQAEIDRLKSKGKGEEEMRDWSLLATEVVQAINSKQLLPVMRTQYMRTAFQIPFDATVRISLDSNLCMILERTRETNGHSRWYRDPGQPVPRTEITRFPHAVLEVKLQLQEEGSTPHWVTDLINSGMLMEVHKFSKFIHGCAVLIPEDVRDLPYWVDDSTLKDSILRSGADSILAVSEGANEMYKHLLPHDEKGNTKMEGIAASAAAAAAAGGGGGGGPALLGVHIQPSAAGGGEEHDAYGLGYNLEEEFGQYCEWAAPSKTAHVTGQKVEPKLFFANERTFIKWLHMAVILSSISVGVLAFSSSDSHAQYYAVLLLPLSLLFVAYAIVTFLWRSKLIRDRSSDRWDDPLGPVVLTALLILALSIQFFLKLRDVFTKGSI